MFYRSEPQIRSRPACLIVLATQKLSREAYRPVASSPLPLRGSDLGLAVPAFVVVLKIPLPPRLLACYTLAPFLFPPPQHHRPHHHISYSASAHSYHSLHGLKDAHKVCLYSSTDADAGQAAADGAGQPPPRSRAAATPCVRLDDFDLCSYPSRYRRH